MFAAASTLSDFLLFLDSTIHSIMNLRVTFSRIAAIAALASPSLFAPGVFGVDPSVEHVRIDPETGAFFSVRDVCGGVNSGKCNTGGSEYGTIFKTLSEAPLTGRGDPSPDIQALESLKSFIQGNTCKFCVEACDLKKLCVARLPILKAIRDIRDKDYVDSNAPYCGQDLTCGTKILQECEKPEGEKYVPVKKILLEAPRKGGPTARAAIASLRSFFITGCPNCVEDSTAKELCGYSDGIVKGIRDYNDANYVSGLTPYCKEEAGVADPKSCTTSDQVYPELKNIAVDPNEVLQLCEGDCDHDHNCAGGTVCFQREGLTPVPGCSGTGIKDHDYCIYPELQSIGIDPTQKLQVCQGDCDKDSECADGLVCFQREGFEPVPGCRGTGTNVWDYCIYPDPYLNSIGRDPIPVCQGDCYNDSDCADGLVCFQREGFEPVPGCRMGTGGMKDYNYCIYPEPTLQSVGVDLSQTQERLQLCEGDCDGDHQCAPGLRCYQRDGYHRVPGCRGAGTWNFDYCVPK